MYSLMCLLGFMRWGRVKAAVEFFITSNAKDKKKFLHFRSLTMYRRTVTVFVLCALLSDDKASVYKTMGVG